jgi:membrane protease YdiL (CAAX protease family)
MSGPVIVPPLPDEPPPRAWEPVTPIPGARPFPGILQSFGLLLGIQIVANLVGLALLLPGIVSDVMRHGTLTEPLPLAGVGIVANSIAFGLLTLVTWRLSRLSGAEAFPLRPVSGGAWVTAALLLGGTVVAAELLATGMMVLWPPPDAVRDLFKQLVGADAPVALTVIFLVVIAPVTEEFFFRGVLQKGLARRYGRTKSIVWSGILFGLVHLLPWQVVPAALLGMLFAWWTDRTGSLWPALVGHAANNAASYWLSRSQPERDLFQPEAPDPIALAAGALLLVAGFTLARRFMKPAEPETVVERSLP